MSRRTVRCTVVRVDGQLRRRGEDHLAGEEPLELRVNGRALTVTMRTPGADVEWAHGFLLTEGVITSAREIAVARYCAGRDDSGAQTYNVLDIRLAPGVAPPSTELNRNFYTTSSCGVCGKSALDAVRLTSRFSPSTDTSTVSVEVLRSLPDQLRAGQRDFDRTGGLHAVGLFDTRGGALAVREDVGRHNAMDKVLGWALRSATDDGRAPGAGRVVMLSGRVSFELVQKAVMAGVPVLAAVSAPSSLAIALAREHNVAVIGFLRGERMNVYCGERRIEPNPPG